MYILWSFDVLYIRGSDLKIDTIFFNGILSEHLLWMKYQIITFMILDIGS